MDENHAAVDADRTGNTSLTAEQARAADVSRDARFALTIGTYDEHNKNRLKTERKTDMQDLFQDVLSMVCMSTFLVSVAIWIGSL